MRILIVEDEVEINDVISYGFRKEGYYVDSAYDGEDALDKMLSNAYDAIILDLNLPKYDGIEVCKEVRKCNVLTPIIMLTARDKIEDKILGLDLGADDYLIKPYDFGELRARVNALVRRKYSVAIENLRIGPLQLDFGKKTAIYNDIPLTLTKKEFDILHYLCSCSPNLCSLEDILEHCFDEYTDPFTNTVRVHLGNLRRKLKRVLGKDIIITKKGDGYALVI